jgi:acetolactate synthase-1/2/3 large subunit
VKRFFNNSCQIIPGLTNAVTGIATAHMDSIPMVVISGQVSSAVIGNDAFQEVDAVGI